MMTTSDYALADGIERAFERRRTNFTSDYGLTTRPALILQCMPAESLLAEIVSENLAKVMREGAAFISNTGWWCAFASGRQPVLIFEGLASSTVTDANGWATEIHENGHFIAGVWSFPAISTPSQPTAAAIADFYVDAFRDFGFVAFKIYHTLAYTGRMHVTCTMLHANQLPLAGRDGRFLAPPVKRDVLRWPILTIEKPENFTSACATMSVQFMRAYGQIAPKR